MTAPAGAPAEWAQAQAAAVFKPWLDEMQRVWGATPDWQTLLGGFARALDAARAEGSSAAWQPIETAPKDSTPVLVARRDPGWGWVRGWGRYLTHFGVEGWVAHGFYDPPGELGLAHPTHWMPLPNPPTEVSRCQADACPYCGNDGCICSHKWGDSCRCAAGGAEHDKHHCSAFQRWLRPEPPQEPK